MIVRVNWIAFKSHPCTADKCGPADMYHVYECKHYFAEIDGYNGVSGKESLPNQVTLILDDGSHVLALSGGDTAYIMNDDGKTIDIIRT